MTTAEAELAHRERMLRLDEIIANIDLKLLDASRRKQEIAWEPWKVAATMLGAASALIAGTVVILKAYGVIP